MIGIFILAQASLFEYLKLKGFVYEKRFNIYIFSSGFIDSR
ncbi:hypothetical protein WALBB_260002 [Wolbachia pipientis wAlbB]|nr:hypothetical protein WALBB_260002 [Wolbachia pipientis wAlbB]